MSAISYHRLNLALILGLFDKLLPDICTRDYFELIGPSHSVLTVVYGRIDLSIGAYEWTCKGAINAIISGTISAINPLNKQDCYRKPSPLVKCSSLVIVLINW